MASSSGVARAGLALAAALFAAGLPGPMPPPTACPGPRAEVRGARGMVLVRCSARAARLAGGPRLLFGLPIDPNLADAATLEVLPGIGPVRARAIVAERERHRFADLEDLARVSGIGPRTIEALRGTVAVDRADGGRGLH